MHEIHDKYDHEITAMHHEEEYEQAHYSRLRDDMNHEAFTAERIEHEAQHYAEEAG